ncbi:MAG: energy transducer TonB [Thiotrichales bacterium]
MTSTTRVSAVDELTPDLDAKRRSAPMTPVALAWPGQRSPRWSAGVLLVVAGAHAGLALGLLNQKPVPPSVSQDATLIASLIQLEAPKAAPEPPRLLPVEPPLPEPKPKPVKRVKQPPKPKPKPKELITSTAEPTPVPAAFEQQITPQPPPPPASAPTRGEPSPAPPQPRSAPRFDAAYLNNPAPQYPPISRRMGEEGQVLLRVHVAPAGTPTEIRLHKSSGYDRLDATARAAVERWRFVPAKRGDEAVAAWVIVPINFTLRN